MAASDDAAAAELRAALRRRFAELPSLPIAVAHELANPLAVIVSNAAVIGESLAAMRARAEPGTPVHAELTVLLEAQEDLAAAAERIQAVTIELRDLTP